MKKTLLVNYVYYPPIGHAIEAFRYTLGYHRVNPDFEISLVLFSKWWKCLPEFVSQFLRGFYCQELVWLSLVFGLGLMFPPGKTNLL